MSEIWRRRSSHVLFCCLSSLLLQSISGLADDPVSSKNGSKSDSHTPSSGVNTGSKVLIIFLAVLVVALFSFFLFKIWQKKKREEQHVRLLKLFEEDDELEASGFEGRFIKRNQGPTKDPSFLICTNL